MLTLRHALPADADPGQVRQHRGDDLNYTYDPNGNMVTRNGTSWAYTYDFENRLTNAVHSGSTVQTNSCDGG